MRVLITGANRGLGKALHARYAAAGAEVIGTSRRPTEGLVEADVTDPASLRRLSERLDGRPLDLLICNAGVYLDRGQNLATGYAPNLWAESFAVNVTGVFLTVQAFLTDLQAAKSPKVAIISSQMGSTSRAPGGSYIYRASKAAAVNLGRNLAHDLEGLGIAVGVYHPGWVRTDMGGGTADLSPEAAAEGLEARFAALSLATTGCFQTWDGRDHPI